MRGSRHQSRWRVTFDPEGHRVALFPIRPGLGRAGHVLAGEQADPEFLAPRQLQMRVGALGWWSGV